VKDRLSLSNFSFFVSLPSAVTSLWPVSQLASLKHWAITMGPLLCMILNFEIQFLAGEL
jgi:hypothetical protein